MTQDEEWPILAIEAVTTKLADVELLHAVPSALILPGFMTTMCGMKPVGTAPRVAEDAIAQLRRFGDVEAYKRCPVCDGFYRNWERAGRGAWDGGSL